MDEVVAPGAIVSFLRGTGGRVPTVPHVPSLWLATDRQRSACIRLNASGFKGLRK